MSKTPKYIRDLSKKDLDDDDDFIDLSMNKRNHRRIKLNKVVKEQRRRNQSLVKQISKVSGSPNHRS